MATESSAVIRLINSVQAQPIYDSFREPIPDPVASPSAPRMPKLGSGTSETMVVHGGEQRKSAWQKVLAAIVLLALAAGAGYAISRTGDGPSATPPPQPQAAAAPAEIDRAVAVQPADQAEATVARSDEAEQQAVAAVAVTGPAAGTIAQPDAAFDAAFDIIVEPAGATIVLDGKELGPAPLRIGRLAAGAHVVDIAAPEGYESQRVELDLISGERQVVRIALDAMEGVGEGAAEPVVETVEPEPEPVARRAKRERKSERKSERVSRRASSKNSSSKSAATRSSKSSGDGTLMLGAKPPCKIYIDGKNTGLITPQRAIKLSAGKHKITLVNSEHKIKATTTVTIKSGKTKRLIKDMTDRL